jgi:tripartite-type tricarboxylate transporter receptor subunit TctC
MRPRWGVLSIAAALLPPISAQAQTDFVSGKSFSDKSFSDKTVKIIVGMPPGGGVDGYARLVQRHLARFLPGAPAIIVQNMPGAGSLRSVMALANSPEQGTAIGTFSSSLITEAITHPERVKIDFRGFAFIGNVSEDIRVCYLRRALGVRTWPELKAREQIIFGATASGTSGNIDTAMLRRLFGVRLKQVQGYAGSADKRLALEKGEIDGDCGGFTSIPEDWLRTGKITVMVRLSPTVLPGLDGHVPFGGDLLGDARDRMVYDFLTAPERLGRLFMVPANIPGDRVTALRGAFDAMVADPAFLAEARKFALAVTPMPGVEVDRRIAELYAAPPDLVALARTIAGE